MTEDRIAHLQTQINTLILKGAVHLEVLQAPVKRAKAVLDLLIKVKRESLAEDTLPASLSMVEELIVQIEGINDTQHDSLLAFQHPVTQ